MFMFCVSCVSLKVISPPLNAFIESWNSHRIPGRNGGIPNDLAALSTRCINPLQQSVVPSVAEAVLIHETIRNRLTPESTFGRDPLANNIHLQQLRERDFLARFHSMQAIFTDVLHGDGQLLVDAIILFITLSENFASTIP